MKKVVGICIDANNIGQISWWNNQGHKFLNANHFLNPEDADWCDEVVGYLSPEQVAELLVSVKNCTAEEIDEIIEEDCTY